MFLTLSTDAQPDRVKGMLTNLGVWSTALRNREGAITGFVVEPSSRVVSEEQLLAIEGVGSVSRRTSSHPLVDAAAHSKGALQSQNACVLMAGPCAVENPQSVLEIARCVARVGGRYLRGGAYKPRTSPHSFAGHGSIALDWLRQAADECGLGVVTEIMSEADVSTVAQAADIMQIGSRNMQNYALLRSVGETKKPVLLKRGIAATIDEWLLAGEHLYKAGASEVLFCERGVRGFDSRTRNFLDLGAVAILAHQHKLPVVVDPSHAVGRRDLILPLSRAAVAAGAHGLLIETNPNAADASSDGPQALDFQELLRLSNALGLKLAGEQSRPLAS